MEGKINEDNSYFDRLSKVLRKKKKSEAGQGSVGGKGKVNKVIRKGLTDRHLNRDLRNVKSKSYSHLGERIIPSHERPTVKDLGELAWRLK